MTLRLRPILLLVVLLLTALPSQPARASGAPTLENLANGGFEGLSGASNGYVTDGSGSGPGAVAHGGAQSVDLARPGTPDATGLLGRVRALPVSAVPLSQVTGIALWSEYPVAAPARAIGLRVVLDVSTNGNGVADDCFVTDLPLDAAPSYAQRDVGLAASYQTGGAACVPGGAAQTLSALQASPAYASATILEVWIETITDTTATWPGGADVYVDDASLLATHSDRVRIRDAADNLCNGASFADVPSALACSASGATLLLAPITFTGPFTFAQPVTLCGTRSASDADCASGSTGATLQGDGASPTTVTLTADSVTLRGLTIQNGNYQGSARAALVDVRASHARIRDSLVVAPAAAPGIGVSRSQVGILVEPGADDFGASGDAIFSFPSPVGSGASCSTCVSDGILVAGGTGHHLFATTIDMSGAAPAFGVRVLSGDPDVGADLITVEGSSTGIFVASGASPTLHDNNVGLRINGQSGAIGIDLRSPNATVRGNDLIQLAVGVRLDPAGAPLADNVFQQNTLDVLVASGAGAQAIHGLRDFSSQTFLQIAAPAHDVALDARNNDWGVYTRSAILGKIQDGGANDAIDVSCYLDSDHASPVCPPTPAFTLSPGSPVWNRNVAFLNASASHGRPVVSWQWDFGDGTMSSGETVNHVYAAPGVYNVQLTVADSEGATASLTTPVPVSDTAPALDPVANATLGENETLTVRLHATDAEGDPITYSLATAPAGATLDPTTRTMTWQPDFTQEGEYDITYAASDGAMTGTTTQHVSVQHRNAPPKITLTGSLHGAEGQTMTVTVSTTDADGDAVTTSASPMILGMTYVDHHDGTGTYSWTPGPSDSGSYAVTFQASDGVNVTSLPVTIIVSNTDRPSYLSQPAAGTTTILREASHSLIRLVCADPDGDACTIAVVRVPNGARYDATNAILDWTPTYDQAGFYNATFRLNDGTMSVDVQVAMRVLNTDRPPHIEPIANQTTLAARAIAVALTSTDPDGDKITYSSSDAPPGVSFTTGGMSYRPPLGTEGLHTFHVTASDGLLTSSTTVNVTVGVNHPPVVQLSGPTRVDVLSRFTLSGMGSNDPDGSALTYVWDLNVSDATTNDGMGQNLTTSYATVYNRTVRLTVTDADGLSSNATLDITVDDQLFATMLVIPPATSSQDVVVQVSVHAWNGSPLPNLPVVVTKAWQPNSVVPPQFSQTVSGFTGPTGIAYFHIRPDTAAGDLPSGHSIMATVTQENSWLGDTETAVLRSTYSGSLP